MKNPDINPTQQHIDTFDAEIKTQRATLLAQQPAVDQQPFPGRKESHEWVGKHAQGPVSTKVGKSTYPGQGEVEYSGTEVGQLKQKAGQKEKDDAPAERNRPDQSDIQSAQRGLRMIAMSPADLQDLISKYQGRTEFAAQAIIAGAKQMLAAKTRMGAR